MKTLSDGDCDMIMINHEALDYSFIEQHARLIIDTRGIYKSMVADVLSARI